MKYCTKCKKIYPSSLAGECCPSCSRKLINDPNSFSPVNTVTANGFELERIRAALDDAGIAYSVQQIKNDTGLQILNAAPPENCAVYVPLCDYDTAVDILIGIGAFKDPPSQHLDEDTFRAIQQAKDDAKEREMSPQKSLFIRIFSLIAFLAVLTAVAYLTDYLLSFVTPLLGW